MKKMLKKLKVTASVLAVSAMFLMPTAHAEQAAVMPVQEDENCIKENLYNAPGNLFVAGFIGSPQMNFLDAKVKVNGNDVTLTVGKYNMKLPASKAKAVIDGGYDGKTVVMGIRPENVHDSQMFIETSKDSVVECKINVYELLGAEVYLYFDCEGFPMTARVDPRTTARSGDTVKFALDMEKVHLFDKETEITITN